MYKITSQDVTIKDYPIPYAFTGSSRREDIDTGEVLDRLFFVLTRGELPRQPFFYRSLPAAFEIDLSSLYPSFELINETHVTEELTEEDVISEMLEHNFIVHMPPIKEYSVQARIKSTEKAAPRIVEPEEF